MEANTGVHERELAVGLLKLSLYGTRDAAANFQEEVKKFMEKFEFEQSKYNPSMYFNRKKEHQNLGAWR